MSCYSRRKSFPTFYFQQYMKNSKHFPHFWRGYAKCKIIISLISFIMAWLQKPLFNPRDSSWAWIRKEPGVYTRCQWLCAAMASTFGISPPWIAGTSGCSSGTRTLTHPHVWGLGWLCAEQLLSAFASGCQTHSALSLNALPGHSGAAQQKG